MNINIGCGDKRLDNAIGVDFRQTDATDVVHDLRQYPWPFEDQQFDNAIARDIVEHMIEVVPFFDECWRILKSDGMLYVRTTYFMSEQAYRDPTHYHFFTLESFDYFDPDTTIGKLYGWYTDKKWKIIRRAIDGQETIFQLQKRGYTT
jgi:SAM-dependent methyltransferase